MFPPPEGSHATMNLPPCGEAVMVREGREPYATRRDHWRHGSLSGRRRLPSVHVWKPERRLEVA